MDATTLPTRYLGIWQRFADETRAIHDELREFARTPAAEVGKHPLHDLLARMQWVPYKQAHRLLDGDDASAKRSNISSISGLFFEAVAAALIGGYVEKRVEGVRIERNGCSDETLRRVARDPDVLVSFGGRNAVFEVKASPKKSDLVWVRRQRESYAKENARYYLVGGHASLGRAELRALAAEGWVCLTSVSERNRADLESLPCLDEMLAEAVQFLRAAPDDRP